MRAPEPYPYQYNARWRATPEQWRRNQQIMLDWTLAVLNAIFVRVRRRQSMSFCSDLLK
jgi:hypothetical protein